MLNAIIKKYDDWKNSRPKETAPQIFTAHKNLEIKINLDERKSVILVRYYKDSGRTKTGRDRTDCDWERSMTMDEFKGLYKTMKKLFEEK